MSNPSSELTRLGRYEVVDKIATGGMAEVFLARAVGAMGFERLVAVKLIHSNFTRDPEFVKMFIDEARIAMHLHHRNIVQVFDLDEVEGTYFLAMEYVRGVNLYELYERIASKDRWIEVPMALYLVAEVCKGLHFAHTRRSHDGRPMGIIHRDISPQNVLLSFEGEVKITDFGIATAAERLHQTAAGIVKGKYAYMAPERLKEEPCDARVDVFSAGVLLYELLVGENPFAGATAFETIEAVLAGGVPAPSSRGAPVPRRLDEICLTAMATEPEARFRSAQAFADALTELAMELTYARRDMASGDSAVAALLAELFPDERKRPLLDARPVELPRASKPEPPYLAASASGAARGGPRVSGAGPSSSLGPRSSPKAPSQGVREVEPVAPYRAPYPEANEADEDSDDIDAPTVLRSAVVEADRQRLGGDTAEDNLPTGPWRPSDPEMLSRGSDPHEETSPTLGPGFLSTDATILRAPEDPVHRELRSDEEEDPLASTLPAGSFSPFGLDAPATPGPPLSLRSAPRSQRLSASIDGPGRPAVAGEDDRGRATPPDPAEVGRRPVAGSSFAQPGGSSPSSGARNTPIYPGGPSRLGSHRSELSRSELSRSEPTRSEPARSELSRSELSRSEPARSELSRSELSRPEPSRAPIGSSLAGSDPGRAGASLRSASGDQGPHRRAAHRLGTDQEPTQRVTGRGRRWMRALLIGAALLLSTGVFLFVQRGPVRVVEVPVVLRSEPPGAQVTLAGRTLPETTPTRASVLAGEPVEVRFSLPGHEDVTDVLVADERRAAEMVVRLSPVTPPPQLEATPSVREVTLVRPRGQWAHVYLDERDLGPTPVTVALPVGTLTLEVASKDGRRRPIEVEVQADGAAELALEP